MSRRRSPYFMRTKAAKTKDKYDASSATGQTSQDIFYTTESNETYADYDYSKNLKDYHDFYTSDVNDSSRLFEKYGVKRKGSGESYTYDDYTTSGVSYDEISNKSEHLRPYEKKTGHKYNNRKSPGRYNNFSSSKDYERSTPSESRVKKRYKLTKNPKERNYEDILEENEQHVDKDRNYRSSRSKYYKDLIHEEPEKENAYETYFEQTRQRGQSSPKHKRKEQYIDGDERYENQSNIPNKGKDYQVLAYQELKQHQGVSKDKKDPLEDSPIPSEIEIKTHEYPVLAFRKGSGKQQSDVVYLPVIVFDKQTGKPTLQTIPKEPLYQTNNEQVQVFAANLQDQQNIFQNFGGHSNLNTPKEKEETEQTVLGTEAPSSMRYANSLLGSMIDKALLIPEIKNTDTKVAKQIPFTLGKSPLIYQVDVDISSKQHKGSLNENTHVKNGTTSDPLHDGYPVTKDYIKVSSEHQRKSIVSPQKSREDNTLSKDQAQRNSEKKSVAKVEPENPSGFHIIDDKRISLKIAESKASHAEKSIIKVPSQEILRAERNLARKSAPAGTKQGPRAKARPSYKTELKEPPRASPKLNVVHKEIPQDLKRKPSKTSEQHEVTVNRGSKMTNPVLVTNTSGTDIKHSFHETDRKSMKPVPQRESTVGRKSIVQTAVVRPPSSAGIRKSDFNKEPSQGRKSNLAGVTKSEPPPVEPRVSASQTRRSVVSKKPPEPVLPMEDNRKSKQLSAPEPSNKVILSSQGRKSGAHTSLAHQSIKDVDANKVKQPYTKSKDDSADNLKQFTRTVFEVDLDSKQPQEKTPTVKSEIKKPDPSVGSSNICPSCRMADQMKKENEKVIDNTPISESKGKKTNLIKTTSKVFTALSKLGKKKTDQEQSEDHSNFVRSIEPKVTQHKNEQKKTTLVKSNSKSELPKEKKTLSSLFSRSKSKLNDGSGDDGKKKTGKTKSRSILGILRRSKSNASMDGGDGKEQECECIAQFVKNTRSCAYFFLGTTLHEKVMNIMEILLNGKQEVKKKSR